MAKKLTFATVVYVLSATVVIPSETVSKDTGPSTDEPAEAFKITAPAAPYTFDSEIMDRMRKKLMAFMGVEPIKRKRPLKKLNKATDVNRRRLSALILLKRLKKYEMEKDARTLADLRHNMVAKDKQRQELVNGIRFKIPSNDANFTPYMQQYVPAAKAEILFIATQMTQLESKITSLEKRISAKFHEFKTFDILHDTLAAEMRHEQDVYENAESEELTLWRWTQKQRAARRIVQTDNIT